MQGYQVTNEQAFLKSGLYQGYCIETEATLLNWYSLHLLCHSLSSNSISHSCVPPCHSDHLY